MIINKDDNDDMTTNYGFKPKDHKSLIDDDQQPSLTMITSINNLH